jgi:hypothetical protein
MLSLRLRIIASATIFICLSFVPLKAEDPVRLSVRKIELYKNGMGYFEHLGSVQGPQNVEISLTSSQLNDALKSLTILDLGRGQIGSVNYDSAAPLDKRLAEVPIDLNSAPGLVEMLNQLRGAGLEIRTPGGVASGKLMGAELRMKNSGSNLNAQYVQVTLFTEGGEVKLIDLESAGALKFTDSRLATDLGRYLDLLNTTHQRDVRRLQIKTLGTGERQIFISYTSEAPIWKTTYRLILDPKQKTLLQGWAIVDNTTSMDWLDVSLSLVSGAPISFIQNLSQPIYARRPVVPLAAGIQAAPQTYESTMGKLPLENSSVKDLVKVMGGVVMSDNPIFNADQTTLAGLSAANVNVQKDGVTANRSRWDQGMNSPVNLASPQISEAARRQAFDTAQAQAVAEQFQYKLRQPVTIKRNSSALLPIIQSDIEGEKVSVFQARGAETRPRLAFWLKNASGLTLDAGPVTIIDSNTFAGEGLIESVQPGENRLLSYAIDLGTEISTATGNERQRVERVQIDKGLIRMFAKTVDKKTYNIRNNNETPRAVVIEHPVRNGWKLISAAPVETSANFYRFKIEVKPKTTVEFAVQEESPVESSFAVSSVTPEQIGVWIKERSIDPQIEKSLQAIAEKKNEINDLAQNSSDLGREETGIFRDQERLRGNLDRLGQIPEEAQLRQRYIKQMEAQENRLAAIKTEIEKLKDARSAAQKQLDAMIQNLNLDKRL